VSNLLGPLHGNLRDQIFSGSFRSLINQCAEQYVESRKVAGNELFAPFGLTDCTIAHLCKEHAVLTADFKLYGLLTKQNADVINFNHYRDFYSK
jgi:hypothetical protein